MNTNNNVYFETKRGSILAYSLIILAMMLAIAASISVVTVVQKKSSGETEFSAQAYQTADSGAQLTYKALVGISDRTKTIDTAFNCDPADGVVKGKRIDSTQGGTYDLVFYSDIPGNVQINDCGAAKISDIKSIKSIGYYMNTVRAIAVVVAEIEYIYVGIPNYKDMCIVDVTNPALPIFKKSISNMDYLTTGIPASEERRFPVMFNSIDNKKYIYSLGDQSGSGGYFFSANVSDDPMAGNATKIGEVKSKLSSGFGQAGFAAKFPFLISDGSDGKKWLLVPSSYPVTSAPVSKFEIKSDGSLGSVDNTLKIKTSSSNNLVYGVDVRDPYLYADSQGYLLIYNFLTGATIYDHFGGVGGSDDLATKTSNNPSILKISYSGDRLFAITPSTGDVHVLNVLTKSAPVYKNAISTGLKQGKTMVAVANNKSDDYVYVVGTDSADAKHTELVTVDASSLSTKKIQGAMTYSYAYTLRDVYVQNDHLYTVTDAVVDGAGSNKTFVEIYDISGAHAKDPQYLGEWDSKNAAVTHAAICN